MAQLITASPGFLILNDHEYRLLASFIQKNYGIYLKEEKRTLLSSRLQGLLTEMNCQSFRDFHQRLLADETGEIAVEMINRITTNHTYFMREADHFVFFQKKVLPNLQKTVKDKDLRVWCAACSTGEESYTLAMLIDEFFQEEKYFWDSRILATDISARALDRAVKGVYTTEGIARLPATWRLKYFEQVGENEYQVMDSIRQEVIYRKFNLMEKSFPFRKKFHAIFCRNVMIYFDEQTTYDLVDKFYECTEPGGYLFIGHSETLLRDKTRYRYVMPAVYQRV
ncbi:MAG TPA: protein-glutamate O-methyltransferase CheR [Clostridiales bacterium]|jgi:chemotaxis protein methyltransferase CheR|nr:protein-glutamate O-methyltransferase CheR [Clostridiales bacterium]